MGKRIGVNMCSSLFILSILLLSLFPSSGAEEATSIDITIELSVIECYPSDALWINGTAQYDNSTPVKDSEVLIQITENEIEWVTLTDSNGNYEKQISAIGRYIDQSQPEVPVPSGYTDGIKSTKRVGQTFKPNVSEIHSIDLYFIKSFPSPSSSVTVHIRNSPTDTTDIANVTLSYDEIENGWNNFLFSTPLEVVPGDEYFMLLTSNTTVGSYRNYGRPWAGGTDYENGIVYWEGDPMEPDPYQDIGFFTYYEEPLQPGEYIINVTVKGTNSSGPLYGYKETIFKVIIVDICITNENLSLIYDADPPLEGDDITIDITIQNLGNAPASDFLVDFSLDSEDNLIDSQTRSLDPFEIDTVSTIWTAEAGEHTIYVTADSSELVFESQENNNNASIQIFVDGDNDNDRIGNLSDKDDDNDGYSDILELKLGTDPLDNSSIPDDFDGDFIPDSMDSDMDNDGVPNEKDFFPYDTSEWLDTDFDGIGDNADDDDDADGILDDVDAYPLDTDNDGLDNEIDWDDDADGILDWEDAHLLDTDNDGLRNDVDDDDDGDGLIDSMEEKKHTNPLKWDTDGDGISDKADYDPLDSEITTEPGFPMIYLVVPLLVIVIFVLIVFLASRWGGKVEGLRAGEGYRELPELKGEYEVSTLPESIEGIASPYKSAQPLGDELAGLEEEREEPSPIKDELADIEEEFEETYSPPSREEKEHKNEDS